MRERLRSCNREARKKKVQEREQKAKNAARKKEREGKDCCKEIEVQREDSTNVTESRTGRNG